MSLVPVLIAGEWRASQSSGTFRAENPAAGQALPAEFPISTWADCDAALTAATVAANILRAAPSAQIAKFLTRFAERIEARAAELVEIAHAETGLPKTPRLQDVELPRTTGQLRQAAAAAEEGSWAQPTIDTKANIRSMLAPLGPVWVFGPNNFPFAFNSVSGGDFAAAIATGNPVIAKANTSHPGTSRLLAEEARRALDDAGLPPASVQLLYRTSHADGERLVADARTAAVAYTGSRAAGLKLKAAADAAGKPIYLELSSVNPVAILPGALAERAAKLVDEFVGSSLMGTGQFCTNPSLVVLFAGPATDQFIAAVQARFAAAPNTPLLSSGVARSLAASVATLQSA
ncbi:MAG TPA: aldehyde dehydrogenase family protein, partial [Opitutaceae bacterium]|nr:aldehyde dehydrogenase family protein [Opitutaceae bacterium]